MIQAVQSAFGVGIQPSHIQSAIVTVTRPRG
jgi:hypothetical protein